MNTIRGMTEVSRPPLPDTVAQFDPVEARVEIADRTWSVLHPPDAEALIDEDAYERDERLPYWADLWPSALVLAEEMAAIWPTGRSVLELGCGIGLPAIVAAGCGARVLASDWYPEALVFAEHNARRAGVRIETLAADWSAPPPQLMRESPFDLIIGADILYEDRNGDALSRLLPRLLTPRGQVIVTDPRRPNVTALVDPLRAAGWSHEREDRENPGRIDESGRTIHIHRFRPPPHSTGATPGATRF